MTAEIIAENKQFFKEVFLREVDRKGAKELLEYIEKETDFFTAPASTRFHMCCEGGLLQHSINVYYRLKMQTIDEPYSLETIVITALLHDLCKADTYKPEWRNVKVYKEDGSKRDEGGKFDWEALKGYRFEEKFPYGHGEKSVYLVERFMRLTEEEAMAIRWHMGAWDKDSDGASRAFKLKPLAVMLHIADIQATYFDERDEESNA